MASPLAQADLKNQATSLAAQISHRTHLNPRCFSKGSKLAKILGGFDGEFQATQVDGMQTGERSLHRLALAARTRRFEHVDQSRRRYAYAHSRHP